MAHGGERPEAIQLPRSVDRQRSSALSTGGTMMRNSGRPEDSLTSHMIAEGREAEEAMGKAYCTFLAELYREYVVLLPGR